MSWPATTDANNLDKAYVRGYLDVSGTTTFRGTTNITSDVSMNTKLIVGGDVSMNSKLFLGGDVSMNQKLRVGGDVFMNTKLFVGGDVSMNGSRIDICGNFYANYPANTIPQAAIMGGLGSNTFTTDVSMNSKLSVGGDVSMNTKMYVGGAARLGNTLTVTGATTLNNTLYQINSQADFVNTNAIFTNGNLTMTNGNLTMAGGTLTTSGVGTVNLHKLRVTGDASMGSVTSRIDICGNLYAVYPNNTIPQSAIIGGVGSNLFTADVSMNSKLFVGGDVSMNTKLSVGGDVSMGTRLFVTGAATLGSTLTIAGATTFNNGSVTLGGGNLVLANGNLELTNGNLTMMNGTLTTSGVGTVNLHKLRVTGDASMGSVTSRIDICGNLYAVYPNNTIPQTAIIGGVGSNVFTADVSMNAKLFVGGDVSMNAKLRVGGDVSMGSTSSRIDICGNLYAVYPNNTIPQTAIIGGVGSNVFTADVSMNAKLSVGGDVSMNTKLFVGGDVSMNTKLNVGGAATFGSTLNVNGITVGRGGGNLQTNTAFGEGALPNNSTGASNTTFGTYSQFNNYTGSNNTSIGYAALYTNTAGNNSALGYDALRNNNSGASNSALGFEAGKNNTTGANNTFLGASTNISPTSAIWANSTAIGSGAQITASNQIALGTAAETVLVAGKTALRGDVSMGSVTSRIDICGNLYAVYPANTIPQTAIIGGVGSNVFTADVSMNAKLSVGGDVSMGTRLFVTGEAMFYNSIRQW